MRPLAPFLLLVAVLLAACSGDPQLTTSLVDPSASNVVASGPRASVGDDPLDLMVQLRNESGDAVSRAGVAITFVASANMLSADGGERATTLTVASTEDGTASVLLHPDAAGTVSVTAYLGEGETDRPLGTVGVTIDAVADPQATTLAVSKERTAVGGDPLDITVQLHDANGTAVRQAGVPIFFAAGAEMLVGEGGARVAGLTVVTDGDGAATVSLHPDAEGAVAVTAYWGEDDTGTEIGEVTIEIGSVVMSNRTAVYDGTPKALEPSFAPAEAAAGASVRYVRRFDGLVLDTAPSEAGLYDATAEAGDGYEGTAEAVLTIEPRVLEVLPGFAFADKSYEGGSAASASVELDTSAVVAGDDVELEPDTHGEFQVLPDDTWVARGAVGTYGGDARSRVVGTLALVGADAHNYRMKQPVGSARITPRTLELNEAAAAAKTYDGTAAAVVSGTFSPAPVAGDDVALVGTFDAVDAGEHVHVTFALEGEDAIQYTLADPAVTAAITPRPITVTADDREKGYGQALVLGDAAFEVSNLVDGEGIASVALVSEGTDASADAGSYTVTPSGATPQAATVLANYDVTYATGELVVEPAVVTLTPHDGQSKAYGEADPAELTFDVDGLLDDHTLSGSSLGREAGEDAGVYAYAIGALGVDDGVDEPENYELAIAEADGFEIAPRTLTVTPDADQTKTYGDADPELTFTVDGLHGDDEVTGALSREEGEDVGAYAYTLDGLGVDDGNEGANYALALADLGSLTIQPRTVTIGGSFAVADRAYDGTPDATIESDQLDLQNVTDGDDLRLEAVAAFDDRFVGQDKNVELTPDTALSGGDADSGNYLLDLTGAPTTTADVVEAPIAFDITNKDALTYDGSALPLVVVTEPEPAPSSEPVAYTLQSRRILSSTGEEVDEGVTAIREAGQYRVTVTSSDPRYDGQDAIVVTVDHRAITLGSQSGSKTYGEPDPDLSAVLTGGTLGADDTLDGALAYGDATDAGSYPLDLGTAAIERNGQDVTANYAITLDDSFEIAPRAVSFDIANSDFVADGVHVFQRDGATQVGLEIGSEPSGVTDFVLSYLRTHDAAYEAIPARQQPVPTIEALGTYEVTIRATGRNHAGSTTRTVWLTDASQLLPADGVATDALVGEEVAATLHLANPAGEARAAGPSPLTIDLTSEPAGVAFLDPTTGATIDAVSLPAGAKDVTVRVRPEALAHEPYALQAHASGPYAATIGSADWTLQAGAKLVFATDPRQVGADAVSDPITVELQGADAKPLVAPEDVALALTGDEELVFRNVSDDADVTSATLAQGDSSVSFRATSHHAGSYGFQASNASPLVGIAATPSQALTVNPKPSVGALDPASLEKGRTTTFTVTGAGFAPGIHAAFDGGDVTVDDVTVVSESELALTVTLATSPATGTRDLTLTNLDRGTSTHEDVLTLTLPTLEANDDGAYAIVEEGTIQLAAADLLGNDASSSPNATVAFDGVTSERNVEVGYDGSTLVIASTGAFGDPASFDYRVVDDFGTTATATVTLQVTLAPVDALLFTDGNAFDDFLTSNYEPPTFATIFDTWPRVSGANYYGDPTSVPAGTAADAWQYLTDDVTGDGEGDPRVSQPQNVSPPEGFVSPEGDAQEYFTFEATLFSDDLDDDSIGLIAAFDRDGGTNRYLVAHRTVGGVSPTSGWGLTLHVGQVQYVIAEPAVPSFSTGSRAWSGKSSRVKVERTGDVIRMWATDWGATGSYDPASEIVVDLATGEVISNGTTSHAGHDLSMLRGRQQYGYFTYSQPGSTYLDIAFEGGVARDVAILLTEGFDSDADGTDDTWSGSEVWHFDDAADSWSTSGRSIQEELGHPRTVTSVVEPVGGSSYDSYDDYGQSFEILGAEVVRSED